MNDFDARRLVVGARDRDGLDARAIRVNDRDRSESEVVSGGILGIEFGSTRIKASLVASDTRPLASGWYAWENKLRDGVWTYDADDVLTGLSASYESLADDFQRRYSTELENVRAIGVSGMMHGYLALDGEGNLLTPFRTWRNTVTARASSELTSLLDFPIAQRWSIAHLYQSILEAQPHVRRIAHLTTLAGYVHWKLTGEHRMGVDDASGMFPIDPQTQTWDSRRVALFDAAIAVYGLPWKLVDILPEVLVAGTPAGSLTVDGASLIDRSRKLRAGIPFCPPEGDAGTGMVATNSVRPRSGNVSAGTSMFAMIVLEKDVSRLHEEIDIVVTPDARPVAMVHANNGTSDLDSWLRLFAQVGQVLGADVRRDAIFTKLLPLALEGDADAGGLIAVNYVSGEHITGFNEGRPLFVRTPDSNFTLENFMRAMYFSSLCTLRAGIGILIDEEGVAIDEIRGHGGYFKGGDTGQRMMAAALNLPVSVAPTSAEGGAWGMAVLAAYMLNREASQSLPDYLDTVMAASIGASVAPDGRDVDGFAKFFERHVRALAIERAALRALS